MEALFVPLPLFRFSVTLEAYVMKNAPICADNTERHY